MEFELLEPEDFPSKPWEALRKFIRGPRRQMQVWGDRVPTFAAATVLGLVAVEWMLSQRVAGGLGRGTSAITQTLGIAALILVAEWALVTAASAIASLTGKTGNRRAAIAYLNFGLAPFLLILPVSLLCEAADTPPVARVIVILLLCLKVLALWRAAIETTFKLNRLQSAAAFYASTSVAIGVGLLIAYVAAIGRIASLFS